MKTGKSRRGKSETRRHGALRSGLRVAAFAVKKKGQTPSKGARRIKANSISRTAVTHAPLITLLTDFGTADYYVSAMKGVILSINPEAQLVDVTHEIPAQDITGAAFTLLAAYRSFKPGTIHLAVVDPGVGSARRPILMCSNDYFFVGPDNGIFSYVMERETNVRVFELTNRQYFREQVSNTFHGRDIFAPVAGALSTGVSPKDVGREIDDPVRLESLKPTHLQNGNLNGRIIHIDRFGNCVTSFTGNDFQPKQISKGFSLKIKGKLIKEFREFYSEQNTKDGSLFAIWGSAGFLEVAARNRSAADLLKAKIGNVAVISYQ